MSPIEILQKELRKLHHKLHTCREEHARLCAIVPGEHLSPEAAALFRPGTIARPEEWRRFKADQKKYEEWASEYECTIAAVETLIRELSAAPRHVRWDTTVTQYDY
ncbi:uncharacterized protein H6S33_005256 [Morchella sextelata]|jgi:hypothetical protein|uniref:uncharacterized protein n=1 Tax=Morchella sextelata TaxID=1174677 RepID=UPI001D041F74|nr:uncharacterized protein H6S33_005256 [Morchella sextelata]KAH0605274.1 hypothetical protein H6S33_005256 [Morchella sextelata]